nr:precorrin-3B synthase [Paraburkholderia phosphatilytica]
MNHAPGSAAASAASVVLPIAPARSADARVSVCPGLARIVAARDGGLCRIRLPGGVLRIDEVLTIADVAERHASGTIELTNRANLQLRGVRAGDEHALTEALVASELGPSAETPTHAAADDTRNLMLSPLAGRDPHALFDTRELAAQLLTLLQTDAHCAALSPKFALLLDGGERLAMTMHPHDIWLAAMSDATDDSAASSGWFAWGLAGCPAIYPGCDARVEAPNAIGVVPSRQVPELVRALIAAFTALALPDEPRMRDLLARVPLDTMLDAVQMRLPFALERDARIATWRRAPADPSLRFGVHAQRDGRVYAGGEPPLGRVNARTLRALTLLASEAGVDALHLTPWQGILLPDLAPHDAPAVLQRMTAAGLICDAREPLAHVIACAGSTGCAKSLADTKADARRLAASLHEPRDVHLSGCLRSCASAFSHEWTLLAVAPDRYDLYRRDAAGSPAFAPAAVSAIPAPHSADARPPAARFGTRVATALTLEQAAAQIDAAARSL